MTSRFLASALFSLLATPCVAQFGLITLTGTSHQVALNWNPPSDSSDPVAGYNIYRTASGGATYQLLNSSPVGALTYTDATVQSGSNYDYIVTSVDSEGVESAPSNTITETVP